MKKKTGKILFLAAVCAMLLIPAVSINREAYSVSDMDNRVLTYAPEFNIRYLDAFMAGLNDYVNDRIGFREQVLSSYQIVEDKLFHYLAHPLYEYGKDDWIMTKEWDSIQTFHLDLEEGYADRFAALMKDAQEISQEHGADFMFWLITNKETVYPEYMSAGYNFKDQETKSDKILEALDQQGIPRLYTFSNFMDLKDSVQLYNIKSDPGHWNENGAVYANIELVDFLRSQFDPSIAPLSTDEFELSYETEEYLLQSKMRIDEQTPHYTPVIQNMVFPEEVFWEEDGNRLIEFEAEPGLVENPEASDAPRLLIFGDSYTYYESSYLGNHFSSVCIVHSREISHFREYVELYHPDIVIIEAAERATGPENGFYTNDVLETGIL